jgi:hypothetical protein
MYQFITTRLLRDVIRLFNQIRGCDDISIKLLLHSAEVGTEEYLLLQLLPLNY